MNGTQTQFELYYRLRQLGYSVIPEYRIPTSGGRTVIADLSIMNEEGFPVFLIECKPSTKRKSAITGRPIRDTRQQAKYEGTGVPYLWVRGNDIEWAMEQVALRVSLALFS